MTQTGRLTSHLGCSFFPIGLLPSGERYLPEVVMAMKISDPLEL